MKVRFWVVSGHFDLLEEYLERFFYNRMYLFNDEIPHTTYSYVVACRLYTTLRKDHQTK